MWRDGEPTPDLSTAEAEARKVMENYNVKEVFVCTVHAAYAKETTVKQVI
jgi:uncharacterized protein YegL